MARASTFTNYIRTDLDPRSGTAYRQLETIANRTYDSIAKHAVGAAAAGSKVAPARAAVGATLVPGGAGLAAQTTAAVRAREALAAAELRAAGAARLGAAGLSLNAVQTRRVAGETNNLNRNLGTLASTLNVVQGPLGPLAGRVRAIGSAVEELSGIRLGLAAGAASIFAFASAANRFVDIENKLRPLYETQTEVNRAMGEVERIATGARSALAPTVDLYAKLTAAGRDFRIEQSAINVATQVAAKAATISGSSSESKAAGLFQFAQGIASNQLGGDELKSIRENIPELARALADGLNKMGKFGKVGIGDLKRLGAEGKLTATVITEALGLAADTIDEKFARIPKTLGTATTELSNAFTLIVGRANESIGVTSTLAKTVGVLADNLREVLALGAGIGAAIATPRIIAAVQQKAAEVKQSFAGGDTVYGPPRPTATNVELGNANAAKAAADAKVAATQAEVNARKASIAALKEEEAQYTSQIGKARQQATVAVQAAATQRAAVDSVTLAVREEIVATGQSAQAIATTATADAQASASRVASTEARIAALRIERAEIAANLAKVEQQVSGGVNARRTSMSLAQQGFGYGATAALGQNQRVDSANLQSSLRAEVATKQVLAGVDRELAAEELKLTAAKNAETAATRRATAATQADVIANTEANAARQSTVLTTYLQRQRAAAAALATETAALQQAEAAAAGAATQQAAAVGRQTVAMRASALGARALAGAMNFLKASLPILAITGLVTVLTYLATAESNAERNARILEDSQYKLAAAIDFNTGKIREQNQAKLAGLNLDANQGVGAAREAFKTAKSQLVGEGLSFLNQRDLAAGRTGRGAGYAAGYAPKESASALKAREILQGYADNRIPGGISAVVKSLESLAAVDPTLKPLAESVTRLASNKDTGIVDAARSVNRATAAAALLRGENTARNRELAQTGTITAPVRGANGRPRDLEGEGRALGAKLAGDQRFAAVTTRDEALSKLAAKKATMDPDEFVRESAQIEAAYRGQIAAIDKRNAASSDRASRAAERERTKEAKALEKANREAASAAEQLTDIMSRYDQAPRMIDKARDDVRALRALVGQDVDGLTAKTAANPNGRRAFTQSDFAARSAKVEEGLRQPFNDMLQEYAREEEIQQAILDGRTAEAAALQRKFEIIDRVGVLEAGQYERLLAAADRQERVNAILADRERITATLTGVVDDMRSAVEELLVDLPNNAPKSAADFAKRLFASYRSAQAKLLTDQLFGGVDQRVKDLISGKDAVERATTFAATQFGRTGTAAQDLAAAFNTAKDFVMRLLGQTPGTNTNPSTPGAVDSAAPFNPFLPRTTLPSGILPEGQSLSALIRPGANVDSILQAATGKVSTAALELASDLANAVPPIDVTPFELAASSAGGALNGTAGASGTLRGAMDELTASVAVAATAVGGLGAAPIGGTAPAQAEAAQALAGAAQKLADTSGDVVVMGERLKSPLDGAQLPSTNIDLDSLITKLPPIEQRKPPTLREVYNETGKSVGDKLDNVLGTKFLGKLGSKVGDALAGASKGQFASGVAGSLGIRQNATGAAIGGAVGSFLPIPGGAFIGGLIGGTLGGLFGKKKAPAGSAGIALNSYGELESTTATGTTSAAKKAATGLAGSVASQVKQIADALGGKVTGATDVKIGTYKDDFRVNTFGGKLNGKNNGALSFDNEQDAIAAAVRATLEDGVVTGISDASRRILQSGQDLSRAIEKAALIESIPKRLRQMTDPVRYAVEQLNDEFAKIIAALDEGQGSAEQYAQAQQLYDLQRAQAIQQAQQAATSAIDAYLDEITKTSSSPLSKATVYDNANAGLQKFVGDVQAGKSVDAAAFTTAAKNFNDASRALNGSDQSYFNDFDFVRSLLEKARGNMGLVNSAGASDLPGSPFASTAVQDAISAGSNATVQGIDNQTAVLNGSLLEIINRMNAGSNVGDGGTYSSIDKLAGFRDLYSDVRLY